MAKCLNFKNYPNFAVTKIVCGGWQWSGGVGIFSPKPEISPPPPAIERERVYIVILINGLARISFVWPKKHHGGAVFRWARVMQGLENLRTTWFRRPRRPHNGPRLHS